MSKRPTIVKLAKEYLAYRRQLGYELQHVGRLLLQFARYADRNAHRGPLTIRLAIRWAKLPRKGPRSYWARRLGIVRGFAKHCAILDPDTEIPSPDAFGRGYCRITPYIYTAAEIAALVAAARNLPPQKGLRPHTYATLFGLLACTGLRLREALNLTRSDVDWKRGLLTIRQTKFRKSRLVPLHPTAVCALRAYARARSFASNLAVQGVDQRFIDKWMGHQTEEMRRRYQHLFPRKPSESIRRLSFTREA